jgi:hypothetical protein
MDIRKPSSVVDNLSAEELEKLIGDIESYLQLEVKKGGEYQNFWTWLKVIVADQFRKKRDQASSSSSSSSSMSTDALHRSVASEVDKLFRDKTAEELTLLQEDIDKSIRDGRCADVTYWEQMSREVSVRRARAEVDQFHRDLLKQQAAALASYRERVGMAKSSSSRGGGAGGGGGGEGFDGDNEGHQEGDREEEMKGEDS